MASDENEDKEIQKLRERLKALQDKKKRRKRRQRLKSDKPRGRPRTPASAIDNARTLANDFPIPDVALITDISLATLYRYNIKRKNLSALNP